MKHVILGLVILLAASLASSPGYAQKKGAAKKSAQSQAKAKSSKGKGDAASDAAAGGTIAAENSLEACRDGIDNDSDGHFDCADQDCEIYAMCVTDAVPAEQVAEEPVEEEEQYEEEEEEEQYEGEALPVLPIWRPEVGYQCRDGKDNNADGLVDCHETSCRPYRYCKKRMYETVESPNRPAGLLIGTGLGVAMPNFRSPTAEIQSSSYGGGEEIPFDPDLGVMIDLKAGYIFLKWLGVGVNLKAAFTAATNEKDYIYTSDDPSEFKYIGEKFFGHVGAFIRLQWPFKRIVPFLELAPGYSIARYEWRVYDPGNSWNMIQDYEDDNDSYIYGDRDLVRETSRHFTFGVEPGVDFFIARRLFAIGVRAWLPVIAHQDSSTDNIGIMLSLTTTPMWRERPRLRPEYEIDEDE